MSKQVSSTSLQYADDTNIYRHCKSNRINECVEQLSNDLSSLAEWSDSNISGSQQNQNQVDYLRYISNVQQSQSF